MRHVALDLDKQTAFATFREGEDLAVSRQERFALDENGLRSLLAALDADDHVAMEACPGSRWLWGTLRPLVADVQLVNSLHVGKLLDFFENKFDRNDSGLICRLMKVDELPIVWSPDDQTWAEREYAAHRKTLDQDRTRHRNRIHALLVEHGLGADADKLLKMDHHALLVAVNGHLPQLARDILASILRMLAVVEEELRQATALIIDRSARRQTARPEVSEIAVSLPGVSDSLAFIMTSYIGDPERFKTPGSLVNYAGLVPSLCSSGPGKPRHGHITKRGSAPLRWAAIEAAGNARRTPGRFQNLYQRLYRKTKSHGKAIVACARELLHVLWHLLKKKEPYRELTLEARLRKDKRRSKSRDDAQKTLQSRPDTRKTILNNVGPIREVLDVLARR